MMWSSSPVPSWQYRVTILDGNNAISATGNRRQLLGDMWTTTSKGKDIRQKQRPLVIRPSGRVTEPRDEWRWRPLELLRNSATKAEFSDD